MLINTFVLCWHQILFKSLLRVKFRREVEKGAGAPPRMFILFHTGVAQSWMDHSHTTDAPTVIETIVQEEI